MRLSDSASQRIFGKILPQKPFGKFKVEFMHALSPVKSVGVGAQLVAGHLKLGTPLLSGDLACLRKERPPCALIPAGGGYRKFQDLGNAFGMV